MVVTHEFYEELFSAVFALYLAANIKKLAMRIIGNRCRNDTSALALSMRDGTSKSPLRLWSQRNS